MLAVGAVLLIAGWGITRYAHEQQQAVSTETDSRAIMWFNGDRNTRVLGARWQVAIREIYAAGVLGMAVGAGLIGFAIPCSRDRSDENRD